MEVELVVLLIVFCWKSNHRNQVIAENSVSCHGNLCLCHTKGTISDRIII